MAILGEKEDRKIRLRERRYVHERLMKKKRSEELEVLEEVFDKSTLMIIYRMLNRKEISKVCGVVKSGKESRIYWAKDFRKKDIALKIYLTTSAEFKKGMLPYIEGDPRFLRYKRGMHSVVYLWAQKEFKNLQSASSAKIRVPQPYKVERNVLMMEFIGEEGKSAPLLREINLRAPTRMYGKILDYAKKLYQKARLVHGDLSEYNIMIWKGEPVFIDLSQSVSLEHPMANSFFKRDIFNINTYFASLGVNVVPLTDLYHRIVGKND